jgi:ketosteroid isomerase-like protein
VTDIEEAPTMPVSTTPADPPSSSRAIENLIATYAELVDSGDFAGLAVLLADATFTGSGVPVSGAGAIEQMFRNMLTTTGSNAATTTGTSPNGES